MKRIAAGLLGMGALAGAAGEAHAIEVHVGVMAHNIRVIDDKNADKEDGPAVEFQVNFDSPEFLAWAGSPEPYIVASVNVAGDTSFAGVGLEWSIPLGDGWSIDPGLGYVVHDGSINNPYPNGSPESAAYSEDHVLLGSRDLFRTSIGVTKDFGGWSGQVFFSHLSHGQIIGNGRNQGMDQLGVRVGWNF